MEIGQGINLIGNNLRNLMYSNAFEVIGCFLCVYKLNGVFPVSFCILVIFQRPDCPLFLSPLPLGFPLPQISPGVCIFPPTMSLKNHKRVICVPTLVF